MHLSDEAFHRRDGTTFPVEYWVRPILREDRLEGTVCTFIDITERKQADAQQQLIKHELGHRLKNTMAVAQGIVMQTLRDSGDPKQASATITARLIALGRTHDLLLRSGWTSAAITDVVKSGTVMHGLDDSRIRANGPAIEVSPSAALALTMTFHELCTNAMKYGALSNESGYVVLNWGITEADDEVRFDLRWKEHGGPAVSVSHRSGFGSQMIESYCRAQFGGDGSLSFASDGLEWMLRAPLSSVKA